MQESAESMQVIVQLTMAACINTVPLAHTLSTETVAQQSQVLPTCHGCMHAISVLQYDLKQTLFLDCFSQIEATLALFIGGFQAGDTSL